VPGDIIDQSGRKIGEHDGAIFYTIGQRHGLNVGGGFPYYVVSNDMSKNEVYVTNQLDDERLWFKELNLTDEHWIGAAPTEGQKYKVRTRHRAALIDCTYYPGKLVLDDGIRAITPGQSAVVYQDNICLGGGILV
jgi:tRNA-specific 2-thiouridylase